MFNQEGKMKKGFSLVELSIVIIIIGLLFVGVSVGSSLIEQAKNKSIIYEIQEIERSIKIFVTSFDYLPGDFPDASKIWGDACGGDDAAPKGCVGNADGFVTSTEMIRFWQHLQLAEAMDKSFTGISGGASYVAGSDPWHNESNAYESRYEDGLLYQIHHTGNTWLNYGIKNHLIRLGKNDNGPYYNSQGGSFTAKEVYLIDKKIDDGKPFVGFIQGHIAYLGTGWDTKSCSGWGGTYDTAYYLIDRDDTACQIVFSGNRILGF